jgi:outer membrane protein assembly factor BamA
MCILRLLLAFLMLPGLLSGVEDGRSFPDSIPVSYVGIDFQKELKNKFPTYTSSKIELELQLINLRDSLQSQGWVFASIDSIHESEEGFYVEFYCGDQFNYFYLLPADSVVKFLKLHSKDRFMDARWKMSGASIRGVLDSLAGIYEDHGFPFAKAEICGWEKGDNAVQLCIGVNTGKQYTIKELINSGEARVSGKFLARYSGLRSGTVFSRQRISGELPKRLRDLPYVLQRREPVVQFGENDATVHVFLNKRNASRFDFVLGALPGNVETGRLIFTGTAHLELHNQFGAGERTMLSFQRLRPETQELKAAFSYPYLLDLPFGIDIAFGLYARDTTNRDLSTYIGLSYLLPGGNFVRAFWHNMRTELVGINTQQIINNKRLPQNLDVQNNLYGIEWLTETLDYRFNPRKGWRWKCSIAAGTRKLPKNSRITNLKDPNNETFDFETLYDSLDTQNWQLRIQSDLAWFIPIGKQGTVLIGSKAGVIRSPGQLFRNELYRIGGNHLLRGFDEESIFSGLYQVSTIEYRLLSGPNSYLFVFGDLGWVENASTQPSFRDFPYGFGLGMTFETNIGIFGLTLAQGAQQGNPLDFRATKVHFGYVSTF